MTLLAMRLGRRDVASQPRIALAIQTTILMALFFFHPAAQSHVGKAYFYLAGLNNIFAAVSLRALLEPAIVLSVCFAAFRTGSLRGARGSKCGVAVGLALWFLGATMSFAVNHGTDLVALTYCSVFVSAALVYAALANFPLSERQFDLALAALAIGSLFPLSSGLLAFYHAWGLPTFSTVMGAHSGALGIQAYEDATFGGRGNTASFILIVGPSLLALMCETGKPALMRLLCAVSVALVLLNLMILQQRAAIVVFLLSVAVMSGFWSRTRGGYALILTGFTLLGYTALSDTSEVGELVTARFTPVLTWDAETDGSVYGRTESMKEGIQLALDHLPFGIGPGASLLKHSQWSAHQSIIQQAMETGVIGALGSTLFALAVLALLVRVLSIGRESALNRRRFVLVIGPAAYVAYGLIANMTLNVGYVNTWIVLVVAMLALTPSIAPALRPVRIGNLTRARVLARSPNVRLKPDSTNTSPSTCRVRL